MSLLAQAPELAGVFIKDINKAKKILEEFLWKNDAYKDEDIKNYTIHIHGLKSILANVGETELRDAALKLEQAGHKKDIDVILTGTPDLLNNLQGVIKKLEDFNAKM